MKKPLWTRILSISLAALLIISVAATQRFDLDGDGKTNVWDLQLAQNQEKTQEEQNDALREALGGGDELHKNAEGQWEIWSDLGLRNMAANAQSGDTFVLMQDIDMQGAAWTPVADFNGKLICGMHTISNMKITKDVAGNMGFFANIADSGYVEYLNLKDVNLIASEDAENIGLISGTCSGKIFGSTAVGFVTDMRSTLPGTVYVGGMVGKMLGDGQIESIDNNKLPEYGVEQAINTISAQLGMRFTASGHVVGIVGYGIEAVDSGTLLQDLTGVMPDPNAIAWVDNGDSWAFPLTVNELLTAIDADGNSVVTIQRDISVDNAIVVPYTSTWDLNGHTIASNPTKGNCLQFAAVGSENKITTVKNGTITYYTQGIVAVQGGVIISNMNMSGYGACVGLMDPNAAYATINVIEDSMLASSAWGCVAFNKSNTDFSATGITINNSTLIAYKSGGVQMSVQATGATPGTVTFGSNVDLYTYGTTLSNKGNLAGIDPVKLEDLGSVVVDGVSYTGLTHWTTDEAVISTEVIAEVTNGSETIQVTNTKDLVAAVSATGNTKIKLVKDLVCSAALSFPYSCEIDLNNYSITNSAANAVRFTGVGTNNTVAKIKNGTLNHGIIGVRVDKGSIDLYNVQINGVGGCAASVGFYDPSGAYKANNKIDQCSFYNPNYVNIMFYGTDVEFKDTGVAISNTILASTKTFNFAVTTAKMSGIVTLGDGVELYSPKTEVANSSLYRFLGKVAYHPEEGFVDVTVNGNTISGVRHWSTDCDKEVINILLIGNSYSTTIPQELYNIATNAGYTVNVANLYYPGCIASQHWDWLNNNTAEYQYRHQSEMGGYIRRGDMSTSGYALEDIDWDVIVYQDWFTPSYIKSNGTLYEGNANTLEDLYANHQEPAYNMMQYLKTNYPDAEHYYYQHWAWQIGHLAIPDQAARAAMWDRINTASNKFAEDNDFILIPCGAAFELARDDARIGETLWDTDKSHDGGPGGGQYLNGCVFFETIFQDSCIGDTWRASNGPSEETHQILQQIAHQTIINVHGEDWVK